MIRQVSASRVATLVGTFDTSPAYLGLAEGLRRLVADGRIPVDTRLPSERDLTRALGVSRTTVTRAYEQLREQGYLRSRRGSGSTASLPRTHGHRGDHLLAPSEDAGDRVDLTCAAPSAPAGVASAFEAAVAELPSYLTGTGYYPSGLPALREAIAARYAARGLPTSPEQILVTSGALGGVAVTVRALAGTGDRVLMESPTYPNAVATMKQAGTRVVGVDLDPTGWDIDAVTAALRQVAPRLAYLIPDYHNPTGALMLDEQRERLAAALRRTRTTAVVDESLVELALDPGPSALPFAAHAPDTMLVGSASKAFWGGLRVGWVRAPEGRMDAVVASRLSLDLGAPLVEQLALVHLLGDGGDILAAHLDELRHGRDALAAALAEHLPSWRVPMPPGGLALWCELPEPLSSTLTATAEAHDVLLAAGPAFAPEGGLERFVRLPYTLPADQLRAAVPRIAAAWTDALESRRTSRAPRRTLVA